MRIACKIALIALLCGTFPSEAHAVRLADGEAVGKMFGYAAMCCQNIGYNPSGTPNDRLVGEKYAVWVKQNAQNPMQTMTDFQMGLSLGMAVAAQTGYAHCGAVIEELIGFYEFFGQNGDAYLPVMQEYMNQ